MRYLMILLFIGASCASQDQAKLIESTAHDWTNMSVANTGGGQQRAIYEGSSVVFDSKANAITLEPSQSTNLIEVPEGMEVLLIVKEGPIQFLSGSNKRRLETGSVVLVFSGNEYQIVNEEKTSITYYAIEWNGAQNKDYPDQTESGFIAKNWNDIEFKETEKGGRRNIIREPTPLLSEFEMHVTTLNEGMKSHDPHTHVEEEIILVRFGEVEEMIDGKAHRVGPGSLIFLGSMVPHGIRNIGKGPCEYYAFKWKVPTD